MAAKTKDEVGANRNLSPNQFRGIYKNTAGQRNSEKTGNGPVGSFGNQAPAGSLYGYGVSTVWGSAII
jgi:hypothetical protein